MDNTQNNHKLVPLAIVVAGGLIALSIYFGGNTSGVNLLPPKPTTDGSLPANSVVEDVSPNEHILGNPGAKVLIVEYSDFECPFCKVFHATIHQIMNTYKSDEVAIVYRQFPIAGLHSKAPKEAEASECVAELGGNTAFWKFVDEVFATTGSNDSLDPSQLPIIAQHAGVDVTAFKTCLSSGKYTKQIQNDVVAAGKAGALGTPYSVAINKAGKKMTINGAQPFDVVKATIDSLLK